jgi:hypothetical protein
MKQTSSYLVSTDDVSDDVIMEMNIVISYSDLINKGQADAHDHIFDIYECMVREAAMHWKVIHEAGNHPKTSEDTGYHDSYGDDFEGMGF